MYFEWDDDLAKKEFKKTGVRFSEAVTIFQDPYSLEFFDKKNNEELRLGLSAHQNLLMVSHKKVRSSGCILITSARAAIL